MTTKFHKPVARPLRPGKPKTKRATPSHAEIATRAYFIYLHEGGSDELGNWVRAERELTAA
jgi:Protein of unknown function (DUF2934)